MADGLKWCEYSWILRRVFCKSSMKHRLSWMLYRGRSFSLNNFWIFFLIFSASGLLVFFTITRPSSLYSPIWFLLMCLLSSVNIKVPVNSHSFAPSYAPLKHQSCFLLFRPTFPRCSIKGISLHEILLQCLVSYRNIKFIKSCDLP